ncbi:UPF0606 protein KIAA1549 isoform X1 [Esox lucius]|uniref:UPF0606 protein KIAA1549 isoform X1 n=1 Tax=Esox lucius TaxID=8010 RepID=UPI0014774571|nr:UPF0606 protein KIAA1549 isoform X1 [Esox lucius]
MHLVTSSASLQTAAYSSSVGSEALSTSVHPSTSHPTLALVPTLTPQEASPGGSDVDWSDTFTLEPTNLLLPDMNSLEYYTIQLTKDDSEEHRGTNVTSTSRHLSLMSISAPDIMATSTFNVDPSHMLTASYGAVQPSDNTTWIDESSADTSGSEPLNVTTAETTEILSVPFLEPSIAPTPSRDLSSSLWSGTGPASSGDWMSPVATSVVGLDSSPVLVSVQPTATSSEADIQWYLYPTSTALHSSPSVTSVVATSVAFQPLPGQTELPPRVNSSAAEPATNATTVLPVSVMADQGIDTDNPITSQTNGSRSTVSPIDTSSTDYSASTTSATTAAVTPITSKAPTTTALSTSTTTAPSKFTTKSLPTTTGRQYICDITKPVYFVKVGFPAGATVGYAKSQIQDVLKTEFNKSIELQVAKNPPDFVFRAVSGPVAYTSISVIDALRQSGRHFLSVSHYWKVPDHQYQVLSVLQFVPGHIDVRVCNFSERIEKGLTMAYAEVRRRLHLSANFTVLIVNITMNQPRSQQREPVDVTFAVRDADGYLKGSEVSNHLRLLNMVEFSYYVGFPVLQIAEPFQYPELNTTQLLRSSWVRTVLLGVLDQRVGERTFQAEMERRLALLLGEVLGWARRVRRATSAANHSVQIVSTTRPVGEDQPLEMVYFVDGPGGRRLPAVTTANMLNRLDVQRAAIVLGYRVQGILATPVEKVAGYPPPDAENTSMWIIIGVVVPLAVVIVIISLLYWKLCRTDKLEFQPDAMTTVQQRQKLQAPSVKGFDFAKLHLGQHSKDDIMVIQEPGASGPPPSNPGLKEATTPSENGEAPTPKSKGTSVSSSKVSRSARRRGRISPSDGDSMVSAGSSDREGEAATDNPRAIATPNDSKQARKIPISVLNGKNRIGPPPTNGHDEQLSSASIFEHVDRMSRSADGTRRLPNKIQLIAMQPMAVLPQRHSPTMNGINGRGTDPHITFNKEIQVALRHKSEIEHHRNKIRLRAKRKGHYDFPAMDDLVDSGLTTDPKDQDRIYHKAQMQIDKILDPDVQMPSLFMEPKKNGRGKRSPRQKKKHQLNGGLTEADKDRLISNESDGTYRRYPGVNNVAYVSDPDQAPDSGTPSPNDDVFMGPNSPPPGHAPPPPPYMPPQPSIEEARQQMHSLLDDAFALVSPTSQGSTAGVTLPGVNTSPPAHVGARPWGSCYPPISPFSPRYAELGLSPPSIPSLLQRQGLGSSYISPGDPGHGDQLHPDALYPSRGLYTEDMPSSARPRPVGGTTGAQLHHLTQVGLGTRVNGGYPAGSRAPPGQTGGSGWGPYPDDDFRPTRDPMSNRSARREPSAPPAHLDNHTAGFSYPSEESSSPPNHSSASLIKAIREELMRLSQKQQAVPSYHS